MKHIKTIALFFIAAVFFVPLSLSAQNGMEDVMYLKNGSIYRGVIIEQVPGVSYKIEIMGGSVVNVNSADVDKIVKEKAMVSKEQDDYRYTDKEPRAPTRVGCNLTASYLLYFDGRHYDFNSSSATYHYNIEHGAGINILPEFKRGKTFSVLVGASVQYITAHNYDYAYILFSQNSGTIDKGFQIRFQVPVTFRWTFGHDVKPFFQFGLGIGGDFYQGYGNSYDQSGYPYSARYGWTKYNTGFMNILSVGVGLRKQLKPGLEIITYIEGSPVNVQFNNLHTYQPFAQFHFGFNFEGKHKEESTKY